MKKLLLALVFVGLHLVRVGAQELTYTLNFPSTASVWDPNQNFFMEFNYSNGNIEYNVQSVTSTGSEGYSSLLDEAGTGLMINNGTSSSTSLTFSVPVIVNGSTFNGTVDVYDPENGNGTEFQTSNSNGPDYFGAGSYDMSENSAGNGISIQPVSDAPEPGTVGFFLLGLLVCLTRTRFGKIPFHLLKKLARLLLPLLRCSSSSFGFVKSCCGTRMLNFRKGNRKPMFPRTLENLKGPMDVGTTTFESARENGRFAFARP